MRPFIYSFCTLLLCGLLSACNDSDPETVRENTQPRYEVTTAYTGSGSISPESLTVDAGVSARFELRPGEGHYVAEVLGCAGTLGEDNQAYYVSSVNDNCNIEASFKPLKLSIKTAASEGARLDLDKSEYFYGDSLSAQLVLEAGYKVESITGCQGQLLGEHFQVAKLTSSCDISLKTLMPRKTFTNNKSGQLLQVAVLDNTGAIAKSSQGIIQTSESGLPAMSDDIALPFELLAIDIITEPGSDVLMQITYPSAFPEQARYIKSDGSNWYFMPVELVQYSNDEHSAVLQLKDGGYGDSDGAINGVIKALGGITAIKHLQVTASAQGKGKITPGTHHVAYGSRVSFTLTPDEGYTISTVNGCEGVITGNIYTTGVLTKPCHVSASFDLQTFTVEAVVSEGGSILPGTQAVTYGDTASFTLAPDEGFEISEAAGCGGTLTGSTYTTGAITFDCQVDAHFRPETFEVTGSALEGHDVLLSSDGERWSELLAGGTRLEKRTGSSAQQIYIKLDEQVFVASCEASNCVITPFSLLKAYIAQAFSTNQEEYSTQLINEVLGISSDPFINQTTNEINRSLFASLVAETSLLDVITSSAGDALDSYLDHEAVKRLFPLGKERKIEAVTIEVGDPPNLDEGEIARVFSIATQQVSEHQGSTSGYLSDYVLQTATVDEQTQEVTTDVLYFGFNMGRWRGQLNAETHTLTSAFLLNPTWLFLPEVEKIEIATKLLNSSPFSQAVALYQTMVGSGDFLLMDEYTELLEQAVMLLPELSDSQLNVLSNAATSTYQMSEPSSAIHNAKPHDTRALQASQQCQPDSKPKPLISGVLLDRLTFENKSCDETVLNSRLAVWYGWADSEALEKHSFWKELSHSQLVTPKELLRVTAESSPVKVEVGKEYSLYKSHPNRLISKPGVFNTARGASFVFKIIFGMPAVVNNQLTEKIKDVADKATTFKKTYEPVITLSEGVIASYQLLFEAFETQLKGPDSNTELYLGATKALNNIQLGLDILQKVIDTVANDDNQFEQVDLKALFAEMKNKIKKRNNYKVTRYSKTAIQMAVFYGLLEFESIDGYVDIGGIRLPTKAVAYRLALYGFRKASSEEVIVLEQQLATAGLSAADIKAVVNLSAAKIKGHFAKLLTDPKFRKAFLETLTDVDSIAKGAVATLKSLASATLHNKDEILKAVVTALLESAANKISSNMVPTIIKSMGPQKYAQLILSGADLGAFAADLAMKPDLLKYTTKACDDNAKKVCFAAVAPPVEILPYVVAVEDTSDDSAVYLLDSSNALHNSIVEHNSQAQHDDHSWPDGKGIFGNNINYLAATPINNNSKNSAILALTGAKLSYELDAYIASHQFEAFQTFIKGMKAEHRKLEFDWFVHPYKNQSWQDALNDFTLERSKANALNNNYVQVQVDAAEYDCDLNKTGLLSRECKDVIIRAKASELTNPILKQYVSQLERVNRQQKAELQINTDNLAFLSFTKAAKKADFEEVATFSSPGVRYVSSNMKLGDATWQTGVNVFVVPDYSKHNDSHLSHQQTLINQSTLYYSEPNSMQYLGVRLDRSSRPYNYFGGDILTTDYRIDNQAYYPVILAKHQQTNEIIYLQHPAVHVNGASEDLIKLNGLPNGYRVISVFLYDSVFASYLNSVDGDFVTWFKKRRPENHKLINDAKAQPVTYNQFAGQPYLRVDLNNPDINRVKVTDELTPLQDTDGDGVADEWDSFPQHSRFAYDSDGDGVADAWEVLYGFDPYSAEPDNGKGPSEDFDEDGYSNLAEFTKTLALPSNLAGYDPTTKTAQWHQQNPTLSVQSGQANTHLVADFITLYGEQQVAEISFTWPEENALALPQASLSADGTSWSFTVPASWPDNTSLTLNLHAQLTSGELVVYKRPAVGGALPEMIEYTPFVLQVMGTRFDGFDYPIGNRGLDQSGNPIPFSEQLADELNHSYSQNLVTDNHTRHSLATTQWRNAQDVGSFLGNYGGTLFGGVHPGEDWNIGAGADDAGEAVFAIANGVITHLQSTYQSGYQTGGYTMVIEHTQADGQQVHSVYTHVTAHTEATGALSTSTAGFHLQVGDRVNRGDAIARIATGMTAVSPHLHFELRSMAPGTDIYPNDNGMGYYSHDGKKYASMTAAQIVTAFNRMKNDEGLLDPSDFIDFNRSGVTGRVNNIVVSHPPKLGEQFTLIINGRNLPTSIAAAVHDATCGPLYDISSEQAKLDCIPNKAGKLFVYVKQTSGGVYLHGAGNLWLDVAESDSWVLGVEFADIHFAQCVREHVNSQQVTRLADLTALNCSGRGINSVAELSHLTGLVSLNLSNNALTSINLDSNLALSSADLRGNPFTQTTLDYLASMTHVADLKYLNTPPPSGGTGKLNDTGITRCADGSSNNLDCPVTGYKGQDAEYGRDALAAKGLLQKVGGGNAGFDFTKLDANGNPLPESASQWSCVKDNHTGLIWEVKTDDGGLHDKDDSYSWYEPSNPDYRGIKNTGTCSIENCDSYNFLKQINSTMYCGIGHWRLPEPLELESIVHYGFAYTDSVFEKAFFLYGWQDSIWTSVPIVTRGNASGVWCLSTSMGRTMNMCENTPRKIRAVASQIQGGK
ncbi:choice-of-anchor U domain-containing protein [Pseudoalteromonas rubra]|uniref:choice-of-anchor U domain-containing protein n=1 Tax=Pseudoalteromonas rubra TaxID=43658 RepID=UPI001F0BD98B|nr:choice-of-anchor U domain-containing protein [Pseudoalteromonas rubra]